MRPQRPLALRSVSALLAFFLLAGCVKRPDTGAPPAPNRSAISRLQLEQQHYENAYEAVEALHSTWLSERGTDSFSNPTKVVVYMDNVRLGGVETLRTVSTRIIYSIAHLNGVEASARYGIGHGAGAIVVATYPIGAPPAYTPEIRQQGNSVIENVVNAPDGFVLARVLTTNHRRARPGVHVLKYWMVDPGVGAR